MKHTDLSFANKTQQELVDTLAALEGDMCEQQISVSFNLYDAYELCLLDTLPKELDDLALYNGPFNQYINPQHELEAFNIMMGFLGHKKINKLVVSCLALPDCSSTVIASALQAIPPCNELTLRMNSIPDSKLKAFLTSIPAHIKALNFSENQQNFKSKKLARYLPYLTGLDSISLGYLAPEMIGALSALPCNINHVSFSCVLSDFFFSILDKTIPYSVQKITVLIDFSHRQTYSRGELHFLGAEEQCLNELDKTIQTLENKKHQPEALLSCLRALNTLLEGEGFKAADLCQHLKNWKANFEKVQATNPMVSSSSKYSWFKSDNANTLLELAVENIISQALAIHSMREKGPQQNQKKAIAVVEEIDLTSDASSKHSPGGM